MPSRLRLSTMLTGAAILVAVFFGLALHGAFAPAAKAAGNGYHQTNLVADVAGQAAVTDANLVNPWGLVAGPTTPWWIADNHSGFSTVYSGSGQPTPSGSPLVVAVAPPGGSPAGTVAAPTGIVFNGTSDFMLDATNPARFIFSTEDGTISGWASGTNSVLKADNSSTGAVYKGLAIGGSGQVGGYALSPSPASNAVGTLLFATDFHNGKIDVFDASFDPVNLAGSFADPNLPAGFAPFNIQNLGGQLYVTFAKQDADKHDDTPGVGSGFVDVFDMNGTLVKRLISQGKLNSPWGMALAASNFSDFSGDLLVGNFGDGAINAFDPGTGAFVGTLADNGNPIIIPGLWALAFGHGIAGDAAALYFTAGPGGEEHGLFGTLTVAAAAVASVSPTPQPSAVPTASPKILPTTGGVPADNTGLSVGLLAIAIGAILAFGSATIVTRVRRSR
jgi:uncharacterized protein (TIGR03118 family)